MASWLSINIFLQVQVDGSDLCGQAISESALGYSCSVVAVQPLLRSDSFKSQLARRWNMQKGVNEQQHPSRVTYLEETDKDSKKSVKKTARKSCEQISFIPHLGSIAGLGRTCFQRPQY
jgi:hypothetical protein